MVPELILSFFFYQHRVTCPPFYQNVPFHLIANWMHSINKEMHLTAYRKHSINTIMDPIATRASPIDIQMCSIGTVIATLAKSCNIFILACYFR